MPGTLYVVATPIGNLEDITLRALRTLREVNVIAAEDTRRTSKLLAHYEIRRPLVSLHTHNEGNEAPRLVRQLLAGASVAVVSDAGTPGIADPGAHLVRLARARGVRIVPIPGPSAISAALSVSGFSADSFVFLGFPPRSGTARQEWLERAAGEDRLMILFEAPHRFERTLDDLLLVVKRPIFVCREITKLHEELVLQSTTGSPRVRAEGEFVLIISPVVKRSIANASVGHAVNMIGLLTESGEIELSEAVRVVSKALDLKASEVRKQVKLTRYAVAASSRQTT